MTLKSLDKYFKQYSYDGYSFNLPSRKIDAFFHGGCLSILIWEKGPSWIVQLDSSYLRIEIV
jgi:hypothetical protein